MAQSERPTPQMEELPGGWIETPMDSSRQHSYTGTRPDVGVAAPGRMPQPPSDASPSGTYLNYAPIISNDHEKRAPRESARFSSSSHTTVVPSPEGHDNRSEKVEAHESRPSLYTSDSSDSEEEVEGGFVPVEPASSAPERPKLQSKKSAPMTEDDLFRVLSRRKTTQSISRVNTGASTIDQDDEEQQEINKLMSRMFGRTRQAQSEEEKTRHLGVLWKNLTVKGAGVGSALQPSVGDIFLNPGRFVKNLFASGPRKAAGKPPVRTILDDFSGCIKPGEMLLVLGRPGAGCSTFLKIIGNQRFGYTDILGDVTYGGTGSEEMRKKFRSEVLYNPEDDLHYATLKVKDTLKFALKTKTPGKDSRKDGESRQDYVAEFLRVVSKLFWIEHTVSVCLHG